MKILSENRFNPKNDDFEDIFSNSSKNDDYEDIYSSSASDDDFNVFLPPAAPRQPRREQSYKYDYNSEEFKVKYNSAVQNRQRQEINYRDIDEVYEGVVPAERRKRTAKNAPRKKKHTARNIVIAVLVLILGFGSCAGIYGYSTVKKLLGSFDTEEQLKENKYIASSELYRDSELINVLLIGTDAREGETESRSDTMMLVTLDKRNKQIKLTSFLRDSYVEIAGRSKKEKLNAAYFRNGIQGLSDTLELNFKVDIDRYILVDFEMFTSIVDQLGGIDVEVTEKESYYTYHSGDVGVPVRIEAGESVHLNGEQALWYSRIRYLDSDFMRTQRQRKVITAIVEKAKKQSVTGLLRLAENIFPLVKTNFTANEIMDIGMDILRDRAFNYPIVQQQIPAEGTWTSKNISGVGSSLVMDLDKNAEILKNFLKNKQETE